jgi:hypothetical protein
MPVNGHNARLLIVCPECGGSGWESTEEACGRCSGGGELFVQPETIPAAPRTGEEQVAKLILALRAGVAFDTLCKRFSITAKQLAAYRANETRGTYDENGYPRRYDKTGLPIKREMTPEGKRERIRKAFAKLGLED